MRAQRVLTDDPLKSLFYDPHQRLQVELCVFAIQADPRRENREVSLLNGRVMSFALRRDPLCIPVVTVIDETLQSAASQFEGSSDTIFSI